MGHLHPRIVRKTTGRPLGRAVSNAYVVVAGPIPICLDCAELTSHRICRVRLGVRHSRNRSAIAAVLDVCRQSRVCRDDSHLRGGLAYARVLCSSDAYERPAAHVMKRQSKYGGFVVVFEFADNLPQLMWGLEPLHPGLEISLGQ